MAPVPREYRDIPQALATRARETLNAIYVLQVATAAGTMAVAYPLFWLLGYEEAFMIALLGGILQFIPMIGPSLVIVPIAVYELAVGNVVGAILVGGLGLVLVAWLPDMLVRPRLSRYSGGLPGSLYFIGFTGGLFTLGPIGIVVGPLVVALFVESMDLLADEVDGDSPFADLGATPDDDEAAVHYEDATADPPD